MSKHLKPPSLLHFLFLLCLMGLTVFGVSVGITAICTWLAGMW